MIFNVTTIEDLPFFYSTFPTFIRVPMSGAKTYNCRFCFNLRLVCMCCPLIHLFDIRSVCCFMMFGIIET